MTTRIHPDLSGPTSYRILIVDDNPSIHDDFSKILCPAADTDARSAELESLLFGSPAKAAPSVTFELDSASQGQLALEKLAESLAEDRPYALAFVDIRMPPGWDGVETVNHLWDLYPSLQVVICTAYSDYSWEDMRSVLKQPDSLVVLKKPFDNVEIQQLAHTLSRKWELNLQAETSLHSLEDNIRMLLAPTSRTATSSSDPDTRISTQSDGHHFLTALRRLSQTLETTRNQLRQAEQQLVHSEKMASIGRLSAGILHEINNPLNYSMAALSVLEYGAKHLPDDIRADHLDTLKDMRDGCSRMMEITGSLRKFAHPESGPLREVQVNDAVRTALRLMAAEISGGITVENRIAADLMVLGAGSKLTQVFINLIHNAAHALRLKNHEPGAVPRILFEAKVLDDRTVISVSDNGIGIPAAEIGNIFDPFYTTKAVGQGTGLGLGICHQILKQFGAVITVDSEPEIHTRFDLSFPDPGFQDRSP